MSTPPPIPPGTLHHQRRASDPQNSAWVSANAGSGKTFVLTRRVIRLLLEGTPPARILCLTFTKAAAANMANRVFETLAAWVLMDDAALRQAIEATGAARPDAVGLAQARRLFARTVESPGGLKILTIHAFCERVLHSFPFEANVPARFGVVDEAQAADLLARAQEAVLAQAVAEPETPLGQAVTALGSAMSWTAFAALVAEMTGKAEAVRDRGEAERFRLRLATALDVAGQSVADIERDIVEGGLPFSEWASVARALGAEDGGTSGAANRLLHAATVPENERLDAYLLVALTQKLEPRADTTFLSKALRNAQPALCARLDAERVRLPPLLARRKAAQAVERTMALTAIGDAVLHRYERLKRARGALDFADLIERTRTLLSRAGSAWVVYKLDQGIDHVLIDEAQDTSPEQWEILQALSRDFFAGAGRPGPRRTLFAVGDEKQSIYSFQGARPAMFDATRRSMRELARGANLPFEDVSLLLSFRSAQTILRFVDRLFAHGDNARGLSAGGLPPTHEALKVGLPGLVEFWPATGPSAAVKPSDWRLPLDVPDTSEPSVVVARRVADRIKALTAPDSPDTVAEGAARRPVRAGDVLILVRSRNAFFDAVIRALKERAIPVAGADRLNLTDHIAVMDLIAAGRAALLPDDDLTLACVLKSPLVGLDDEDLLRLAPERTGSLAEALQASLHARDRAAAEQLAVWRDRAATLTPFAFYTRLLGRDGGRRRLLGRLGPEAGDVIDEFIALTLAHERDGAPSLLAFLARLEGLDFSVKRDLEHAGDAVRVMTVHAAKGLEAKIVFLPDTCGVPSGRHDPKLFEVECGLLVWSPRSDADPPPVARARTAGRDAALEEHRRLLYVALTRAEERLYITGFHGSQGPQPGSWHDMIAAADLGMETVPAPWDPEAAILRLADPMPPTDRQAATPAAPQAPPLPGWIHRRARPEIAAAPPIRPSTALGAADRFDRVHDEPDTGLRGEARRTQALEGRLLHRLLQHLPGLEPARRRDAAQRYLALRGSALSAERAASLVSTAMGLLDDPQLGALFGPQSRAEVQLAATLRRRDGSPLAVTGQIDRIAVTEADVLIADFKSGRPRPAAATPPSYLTQLALYRAAVEPLYPGRPVRAILVWTAGPTAVELEPARLDDALEAVLEAVPAS